METLRGIIPAIVTPFDSNNKVDHGALKALVEHLIGKGVNGFYACGSTGECFLMTEEERMATAKTIIDTVNGRVPVAVQVGNIATDSAVRLAKQAAADGADYISSVPPFYFQFSLDEIARYYARISKAVDKPLIIYNIPAFSGVSLNTKNMRTITDNCDVWGLKYTAYDLFELEKIRRAFPELNIYYGHDELFLNSLPIGTSGAIGSTFNVMSERYQEIKKAYDAGKMEEAGKMQSEVNKAIEAMISCGVMPSIKYILSKQGIPCGNCREPFSAVTEEQKTLLDVYFQ
ncbi:MAG: N-acetylneuraminate lyase [Tyzzerella sp.]|nr:N-acetylneuraminate lyase [Tyzzerella sp.]